jgi:hypothetical protein
MQIEQRLSALVLRMNMRRIVVSKNILIMIPKNLLISGIVAPPQHTIECAAHPPSREDSSATSANTVPVC